MIEGITGIPLASKLEGEDVWRRSRSSGVSASVVADCYPAVHGAKVGYNYPTERWAMLVANLDPDRFPSAGRSSMDRNLLRTGEMLQPAVEEKWLAANPDAERVEEACERNFQHPEFEYLTATPDLVVRRGGELEIVEIKCTQNIKRWTDYGEFCVPTHVRIQVAQQMGILGVPRARVVLYPMTTDANGEEFWDSGMIRNDELQWRTNLHWATSMHECVDTNTAPRFHSAYADYADYELGLPAALAKIHSTDKKEASDIVAGKVSELRDVKLGIKKLVQREKLLSNELKGEFGLASELTHGGRCIATYSGGVETDRPSLVVAAKEAGIDIAGLSAEQIVSAFPRLAADDYHLGYSRRLRIVDAQLSS